MKQSIFAFLIFSSLLACKEVNKKSVQTKDDAKVAAVSTSASSPEISTTPTDMESKSAYVFPLTDIDGKSFSLKEFAGKKILIVNTASKCGYTPQYADLQKLSEQYKDKLVVVGFPCNDFGGQEPEAEANVKSFCQKNYGVTFPLTEKVAVKGDAAAPIYKWLTQKSLNGVLDATIKWNFNKFLLNEKGELLSYFPSSTKPLDPAIVGLL